MSKGLVVLSTLAIIDLVPLASSSTSSLCSVTLTTRMCDGLMPSEMGTSSRKRRQQHVAASLILTILRRSLVVSLLKLNTPKMAVSVMGVKVAVALASAIREAIEVPVSYSLRVHCCCC